VIAASYVIVSLLLFGAVALAAGLLLGVLLGARAAERR
jgi:hypothetical protein